jgi:hypothetical protein
MLQQLFGTLPEESTVLKNGSVDHNATHTQTLQETQGES